MILSIVHQARPFVVAHRGASADRPEHTLEAYALALEQGADGLECDVRVSRDGHLVCVHDRRIDRVSSGRGVVSELTLRSMSTLDFGSWWGEVTHGAAPVADQRSHPDQHGVLTLEALLGLIRDSSRPVTLFVETKHPVRYAGLVEAKLVAMLARYGMAAPADRETAPVVMMSFSSRAVRRVHDAAPKVPTVLLFDRFLLRRSGWLPEWAHYAGPSIDLLRSDPDYVARAQERGNPTYCWTVDEPADVELCQRAGVRYVATNAPGSTRSHLIR